MLTMVGDGGFLRDGRLVHAVNNEHAQRRTDKWCQTGTNNAHFLPKKGSVERMHAHFADRFARMHPCAVATLSILLWTAEYTELV